MLLSFLTFVIVGLHEFEVILLMSNWLRKCLIRLFGYRILKGLGSEDGLFVGSLYLMFLLLFLLIVRWLLKIVNNKEVIHIENWIAFTSSGD